METAETVPTQSHGSGSNKRLKSVSSENSVTQSSSVTKELKNPKGSIARTDDPFVKKTKECIGRFFYENGLDINAVSSPSFQRMISLCSGQVKFEIPTCDELKGWIFEDVVKEMREYVDEVRNSWASTGCSILLDGWTDAKGRTLVNILVDCPRATVYLCSFDISDCVGNMEAMQLFLETVVTEVGADNVVQIITYSTSAFMKEAGEQLTEKYKPIVWTVSASCCMELMLEKLKEIDIITETLEKAKIITRFIYTNPDALKSLKDQTKGRDLIQPSKIKSTQPFLTLENIVLEQEILKKMFLSSNLTSSIKGKNVADIVADNSFWSGALTVSKVAIPIVNVLEWLIDKNSKEQTGYIYETIDQAKETIREGFNRKRTQYIKFWDVIDDVWNRIFNSPIHIAGYYFNPRFFYTSKMSIDPEIVLGLFCYVVRSTRDVHVQDLITTRQLEMFHRAKGAFAPGWPKDRRLDISPGFTFTVCYFQITFILIELLILANSFFFFIIATWWSKYGGDCPELQRLAVRILSQTCDGAAKFQLKRGLAETLLTKGRNGNEQKRLAEKVFVQYNMQLQSFGSGKTDHIATCDAEASDDWMDLEGGDLTDLGISDLVRPSGFLPKVELCK